jgi:Kef-type K+ transport system membrane component KefB
MIIEITTESFKEVILADNSIINLLMVMVIIWTAGVVFRTIKQPPVIGELLAGFVFGPPVMGIIRPDETLHVLSELGIFFLMFYAGLETNPFELKRMTRPSLFVALGGFILPFLLGYSAGHLLGLAHIQALFIGMALSITAIAVNARVLTDLRMTRFRVTPVIIGASIIDDILSLALLTVIIDIANGEGSLISSHLIVLILKVAAFFGISHLIGIILYPKFSKYFSSREAKGFTFALIMALLFGVLAEMAGLHIILGAYMAGLFVREGIVSKELFQKINDRFVSITYGFLGPIFFVSLSFHIDFSIFKSHVLPLSVLLLAAVIGKLVGSGAGALVGKMNRGESMVIGAAMNGRGAVELIIASIGLQMGIIDNMYFSILIVVAFLTTFMPPVSLHLLLKRVHLVKLDLSIDSTP